MLNFLFSFDILQISYFWPKIIPEIFLSEVSLYFLLKNKENPNSLLVHHSYKQEQNKTINAALGVFQTK